MFYVSLTVTIRKKPMVDSQKIKESKHSTTANHQFMKEGIKTERQKQGKYKTAREQIIRWQQ